jgi:glycosyltransferase involved in cell wall biosynthesis
VKKALVYDWLIHMGGGEKTLAAIMEVVNAPIYTLIADKERLKDTPFAKSEIHTSFMQDLPFAKEFYRYYLPFFSRAVESLDVNGYECIISVSHAVAKGVITHPQQLHLCYCLTPMRYAWDLSSCYMESIHLLKRLLAQSVLKKLRQWDLDALYRVDCFAAISHYVAERIKRIYGRDAEVIYPPVDIKEIEIEEKKEDFFLTVSRMVPYKKIDLIVEAFGHCPDKKLVVIGDGPEMNVVKKKAKKNCEILGYQNDRVMRDMLRKAKGFVFAAEEDFGIVPIEAQAAGTPVIAFGKGGALETIVAGESGIFFEEQTVSSMMQALNSFEKTNWDPVKVRKSVLRFSKERFQKEFQGFINRKIEAYHESGYLGRR